MIGLQRFSGYADDHLSHFAETIQPAPLYSGGVARAPGLADVALRPRERRDCVALLEMFDQPRCRLGMIREPFADAEDIEAWFASAGSENFEAVATLDDRAIGLAGLFPGRGSQSHVGSVSLFLHDSFHGRGIGKLMMTAILVTAHTLVDLRRLQLTVCRDNERAIGLYRKFGFEIEGRHECFARRGDEFVAALTMARLADSEAARRTDIGRLCRDLSDLASRSRRLQGLGVAAGAESAGLASAGLAPSAGVAGLAAGVLPGMGLA